jgi:hypothetical protein
MLSSNPTIEGYKLTARLAIISANYKQVKPVEFCGFEPNSNIYLQNTSLISKLIARILA